MLPMLHNVKTNVNIRIAFLSLSIGNWNHIAWCYVMSFTIRPCPLVSGFVCIRKHFVTDSAFVHTCPAKTHTVTANFLKCPPEWQLLKTQRIRLRVDACNRKQVRKSPTHLERCHGSRLNLFINACSISDSNIRVSNSDRIRIHVDGRKRNKSGYMWTVENATNPDTCGRVKFCNRNKMSADTNESGYV